MTAIGFILLFVATVLAFLDDHIALPQWLLKVCGFLFIAGGSLLAAGVSVWLWRVLP